MRKSLPPRLWLAVLFAASSPNVQALQVLDTRDGVSVAAKLSLKEPTGSRSKVRPSPRCSATSGRTRLIRPATSSSRPIPGKGRAYIRPVSVSATKPINLFVSTAHATYTLLLQPVDMPADTIVLRDRTSRVARSAMSPGKAPTHVRALTTLLTAMANDAPSSDMRVEDTALDVRLWQATRFTLLRRYESPGLIGERYLLTNLGEAALALGIPVVQQGRRTGCCRRTGNVGAPSQHPRVCIAGRDAMMETSDLNPSGPRVGLPPKARQWLLLGGILVGAFALLYALFALTDSPKTNARPASAKPAVTTHVQAPGAQVDAKDRWIGEAGNKVAEHDQKLTRRRSMPRCWRASRHCKSRSRSPGSRGTAATPDRRRHAGTRTATAGAAGYLDHRRPGLPTRRRLAAAAATAVVAAVVTSVSTSVSTPARGGERFPDRGAWRSTRTDAAPDPDHGGSSGATLGRHRCPRDGHTTVPTGAGPRGDDRQLPAGVVHPGRPAGRTGCAHRRAGADNPHPVLMRVAGQRLSAESLPLQGSRVLRAWGELRRHQRRAGLYPPETTLLRAPRRPRDRGAVKGYVVGEDGKVGMRGPAGHQAGPGPRQRAARRDGAGIGQAFQQQRDHRVHHPARRGRHRRAGKQFEAGLGTGVGRAMDRLAQYYITLAEKTFPIIESRRRPHRRCGADARGGDRRAGRCDRPEH